MDSGPASGAGDEGCTDVSCDARAAAGSRGLPHAVGPCICTLEARRCAGQSAYRSAGRRAQTERDEKWIWICRYRNGGAPAGKRDIRGSHGLIGRRQNRARQVRQQKKPAKPEARRRSIVCIFHFYIQHALHQARRKNTKEIRKTPLCPTSGSSDRSGVFNQRIGQYESTPAAKPPPCPCAFSFGCTKFQQKCHPFGWRFCCVVRTLRINCVTQKIREYSGGKAASVSSRLLF